MEGDTRISGEVIRAAMEVHRELGPGLLESAYRVCLVHALESAGHQVKVEVPVPGTFRGVRMECGYRIDLVVDDGLIVELKAVRALEPLHTAQLVTYLRLSGLPVGLLVNFNVPSLR